MARAGPPVFWLTWGCRTHRDRRRSGILRRVATPDQGSAIGRKPNSSINWRTGIDRTRESRSRPLEQAIELALETSDG